MNIYEKLQQMRVDLQGMKLKKSGKNSFAGYAYYELGDILPPINQLMNAAKVTAIVSFGSEYATLRLVNCEKPEEQVEFASPMADVTLKGAHDIQNLGAVETYQRRYLYMTAFEVVESDFFDATQGKPDGKPADKPAGKPKVRNLAKPKMSTDMSNALNDAIQGYASMTGVSIKEVMASITKATGKAANQMTDDDGEQVLNLVREWSDSWIEKLGV